MLRSGVGNWVADLRHVMPTPILIIYLLLFFHSAYGRYKPLRPF